MSDSRAAVLERTPAVTDCWNKIGVRGDSSCGELKEHIHCRNCPVYSGAAVALLDAELPADYRSQGALRAGREKASVVLDTHSVVVFRVRSEWLALPTTVLREIVSVKPIHAVPHRRDGVLLGLANIRGELLACFSLSQVLGLVEAVEPKPLKARATERFLVIEHDSSRAVCPVDEVCGVVRFHPRDLIPVPATVAKATSTYTRSLLPWQGKALALLDEELLLHTVDRDMA